MLTSQCLMILLTIALFCSKSNILTCFYLGKRNKEKLEKSRFMQQNLPCWRPNPTFLTTLITFVIFGVIFLGLGVWLIFWARHIKEFGVTYHETCSTEKPPTKWIIDFEINDDFKAPIYVYYQIDNLFQNHRRYVNSRSDEQLRGNKLSESDIKTACDPIVTNDDLGFKYAYDGITELVGSEPAHPWGLIAQSYFNDTFVITSPDETFEYKIRNESIAWSTDVSTLFKNGPGAWETYQWANVTDERFITWMRVAGMKNFKKPYGIIHQDMDAGKYRLSILNNYLVKSFGGTKRFFMSTTNSYGGRNEFLAIWYLVVGGLWILFAMIFFVAYLRQKKKAHQS